MFIEHKVCTRYYEMCYELAENSFIRHKLLLCLKDMECNSGSRLFLNNKTEGGPPQGLIFLVKTLLM